jgi:hypothetical protein
LYCDYQRNSQSALKHDEHADFVSWFASNEGRIPEDSRTRATDQTRIHLKVLRLQSVIRVSPSAAKASEECGIAAVGK